MGPLQGYKIIELAGIGPGPFCGMMLADMGAEVIRIDRHSGRDGRKDVLNRSRKTLALDLKKPEAVEIVLKLVESADALFEGFRPGVCERLGLGPDLCLSRNPKLVYGRMTGWGQDGPMANAAGHDINYISLSGALHAIGRKGQKPVPPLNLVGDFGGGGMMLAFGMVCALLESQKSGKGQIIDASMVEGSAALMAMFSSLQNLDLFKHERESNMLDGAAHFYDSYETADGKYISIGSIEPQFYALLIEKAKLDVETFKPQMDIKRWPDLKEKLTAVFKSKTRDQWVEIMEATDVCFAPILSLAEAPYHRHNKARNSFVEVAGIMQHAPTPKFSRTVADIPKPGKSTGADSRQILEEIGFSKQNIDDLVTQQVVFCD
jgi:alpha-methylacyl-CoA racemase